MYFILFANVLYQIDHLKKLATPISTPAEFYLTIASEICVDTFGFVIIHDVDKPGRAKPLTIFPSACKIT